MVRVARIQLDGVRTPEDAHRLLREVKAVEEIVALAEIGAAREREWRGVRMLAEHRWGELLGPAETGRPASIASNVTPSNVISAAERAARGRARKLAAIPKEKVLEHIATDPEPSAKRLLKQARPRQRATREQRGLWEDESVIAWVADRMRAGSGRDRIKAESEAAEHGWPLPGKHLGQNAANMVMAVVRERDSSVDAKAVSRRPAPTVSGKRRHQLYAERRESAEGRRAFKELQIRVMNAVAALEAVEVADYRDAEDHDIAAIYEDLQILAEWVDRGLAAVGVWRGAIAEDRRLLALRDRANDPSSTPNERLVASQAADRLATR